MKKLFFCLFAVSFSYLTFSQSSITISPFIGTKAGITKKYNYFNYERDILQIYKSENVRFIHPLLIPLTFGFTVDYRYKKNIFSSGITFNDGAETMIKLTVNSDSKNTFSNFNRVPVTKISLIDYTRIVYEKMNKNHENPHKIYDIGIYTGINYYYLKPAPFTMYNGNIGVTAGELINTVSNNTPLQLQSFSYFNPVKKTILSLKMGTTFNLYRKNGKPLTSIFLYYEQCLNKHGLVGASGYWVYMNNKLTNMEFSPSRGNSIQLKLAFPITVFNKE